MSGWPRSAAWPRAPYRGPLAPWQAQRPRCRPGRCPAAREPCPTCPLPALKGPCPLPAPTGAVKRLRPLKAPRPSALIIPHGSRRCWVGRAEVPQASPKGPGKYLRPLRGHRYLRQGGDIQLPLKGTAPPLGSNDRLKASPRTYPRELRGPRRGLSLTAASPRALGERCRFCPSSASPSLPFREPAGLGGGGEGVSFGLRESEPARPFGPNRRG